MTSCELAYLRYVPLIFYKSADEMSGTLIRFLEYLHIFNTILRKICPRLFHIAESIRGESFNPIAVIIYYDFYNDKLLG